MNQRYRQIADALYQDMAQTIERFRAELAQQGIAVHKIPPATMQVELIAQVLIQAMAEERIAMTDHDDVQVALQQALQTVRDSVIEYRRAGRDRPEKPADAVTQH